MEIPDFSFILYYKKPEHLPKAWKQIGHIKKNLNGEYSSWSYGKNLGGLRRKPCSLQRVAEFEKKGFVKMEIPLIERSSSELWINSKGEVYVLGHTGDPYLLVTKRMVKPLFVLELPPAPDEHYEIPIRYLEDNLEEAGLREY